MTRVLVTGGTGFIGRHVIEALLAANHTVRALVRPGQTLPVHHQALTLAVGDVRDRASLAAAMVECEAVIHAAAAHSFWSRDPRLLYDVNVDGTHNVLRAALAAGAERIVYTSSVSTLKPQKLPGEGVATEQDVATPQDLTGDYKRSKWEAERLALRMANAGAPVIVVSPTAPMGPGDVKPTPTGGIILRFLRRKMPAVVDTGLNVVDVRDVAEGHVLALERGRIGERYLLGNGDGNLTLAEILRRLSSITGLPSPRLKLPHWPVLAFARVDTFVTGTLLGRPPNVPAEAARMSTTRMWVDSSKSIRELGLPQRPVADALKDAVDWFITNGYVEPPRSYPVKDPRSLV